MSGRTGRTFWIAALMLCAAAVLSAETTWKELLAQAETAREEVRKADEVRLLQQALGSVRKTGDTRGEIQVLVRLAQAFRSMDKNTDALSAYRTAQALCLKTSGEESLECVRLLREKSLLLALTDDPEDAKTGLDRVIAVLTRKFPDQKVLLGECYGDLSRVQCRLKDHSAAEASAASAVLLLTPAGAEARAPLFEALACQAEVFKELGRSDAAIQASLKAMDIGTRIPSKEHERFRQVLDLLIGVYQAQDHVNESRRVLLELRQQAGDRNCPAALAAIGRKLAGEYERTLEKKRALEALTEAKDAIIRLRGKYDPLTIDFVHEMTMRLGDLKMKSEALQECALEIQLRTQVQGALHPDVAGAYNTIAWMYREYKMWLPAEENVRKALTIFEQTKTPYDQNAFIWVLTNHAEILHNLRRYDEAETQYRKVLKLRLDLQGRHHQDVAYVYRAVAWMYGEMGRWPDAMEAMLEAIIIYHAEPNTYVDFHKAEGSSFLTFNRRLSSDEERMSVFERVLKKEAEAASTGDKGVDPRTALRRLVMWDVCAERCLLISMVDRVVDRTVKADPSNDLFFYRIEFSQAVVALWSLQLDRAERLLGQVLVLVQERFSESPLMEAGLLEEQVLLRMLQGNMKDAQALVDRLVLLRQVNQKGDHPDTLTAEGYQVWLLILADDLGKAKKIIDHIIGIRGDTLLQDNNDVLWDRILDRMVREGLDPKQAEGDAFPVLMKALRESRCSPDDRIAYLLLDYIKRLVKQERYEEAIDAYLNASLRYAELRYHQEKTRTACLNAANELHRKADLEAGDQIYAEYLAVSRAMDQPGRTSLLLDLQADLHDAHDDPDQADALREQANALRNTGGRP